MRLWMGLRSARVHKEHQIPLLDFMTLLYDLPDVDEQQVRLALELAFEKLQMDYRAGMTKDAMYQALMDRDIINAWTEAIRPK